MTTPIPNIWQLQQKGDIDSLIEALRHTEASVRKNAAAALRAVGAWQAVPALEAALTNEHDWQAHAAITAALQYLDRDIHVETMIKQKDIRGLSKMLSSPRHDDIVTASKVLGELGDRHAVESLIMVFRNPLLPNHVRLAAAEALLKLESAPAVVTLLGAMRRDNWQVRRNAAAVLGQLQATWATEPLIALLQDPHQAVRRTAVAALRRIKTPEALKAADAFEELQIKIAMQEVKEVEPELPQAPKPRGTGPLPVTRTLPAAPKSAEEWLPSPAKTAPLPPLPDAQPESKPTLRGTTPLPVVPTSGESKPAAPGTGPLKLPGTGPLPATGSPDRAARGGTGPLNAAMPKPQAEETASKPATAPLPGTGPLSESRLAKLRATQQMQAVSTTETSEKREKPATGPLPNLQANTSPVPDPIQPEKADTESEFPPLEPLPPSTTPTPNGDQP
ncbi:MAG: HEAT repeat domain-containing protein [Chloroflexota bacterium]